LITCKFIFMKTPEISIKPLQTEEEIKACAAIMANTSPWTILNIRAKQIEQTLRDNFYESYVAYAGDAIAGVAVIQLKGVCTGYLKSIAVKKEFRKNHIGSLLMDHIEKRILSVHPNVFLCVSSFNHDAKKFYLKRGYEEIGIIKDYLVKGYDEILMRKSTGPVLAHTEKN